MHTSYKNRRAASHQIRPLLSFPIGPTLVPSGLLAATVYDSEADTSRKIANGRLPPQKHCPIRPLFFPANKLSSIERLGLHHFPWS